MNFLQKKYEFFLSGFSVIWSTASLQVPLTGTVQHYF